MAEKTLSLGAKPPFSLPSIVQSHGWWQLAPFGWAPDTSTLTYLGQLGSKRVIEVRVREAPDGVSIGLPDKLTPSERQEVEKRAMWMLGLNQDLAPFYALAEKEPKLAGVVKKAQGRILRSFTLFEDTVKTILTTNTAWSGTIRMVKALVSQFGAPLPADTSRHAFPTPERLASSDEQTLRAEARLGYRAPYILGLARAIAAGDLDLETLKDADLPTSELRKQLLTIKGVGAYAAAHLLMILNRYDFIPIDSWALKMVSHEWHQGQPVGQAEVEAAFEHWGQWKGLAYWFWDWSYTDDA